MILVTGATGTTGSEVVRQLAAAGQKVRALVRDRKKAGKIEGPEVEIAVGDLDRPATLEAPLQGIEKIFLVSSPDPRVADLHRNLIEAAKRSGVRHIVRMAALGSRPDSPVSLLRWHGESERILERSGIPYTFLRPHMFMQSTLMFARSIAAEGTFYAPLRDAKISLVDVRDIAAVAVGALTGRGHESKAYDVTGPEALSFSDVAGKISAATGKPVKYVNVPPEAARKAMLGMGMPDWLVDGLLGLYAEWSAGRGASVSPAVGQVGKTKPRTYEQFAREHAGAFTGH